MRPIYLLDKLVTTLLVIGTFLVSCGKPSAVTIGKKSIPTSPTIKEIQISPNIIIKEQESGAKLQVQKGVPTAMVLPVNNEQEQSLQFWRLKFKNNPVTFEPVEQLEAKKTGRSEHNHSLYQLNSPRDKVTVIYNTQTQKVVEVFHYGL